MKLYYTPLSHYSRKVRAVLDYYKVPCDLVNVGNVAGHDVASFGHNPLMEVPVLEDGSQWLLESDTIAAYLVKKIDASDPLNVLTAKWDDLNIRAVLNGVMANEVRVILARRTGIPIEQYSFFDKCQEAITHGLDWLEKHHSMFDRKNISYREIHLVSLLEHLLHYKLVPMGSYPELMNVLAAHQERDFLRKSSPALIS